MSADTTDKKGLTAANGQSPEDTTDPAIVAAWDKWRKEFASAHAQAAFARCELRRLCGGGFLLIRGGLSRECPTLADALERIGRMQGARHVG